MSPVCKDAQHVWVLNVTPTMPATVMCTKCFTQFKPPTQQIPYKGVVPERFR